MKEFPPFRLDTVNECLWRRGKAEEDERILLTPKGFAVLHYLVSHQGRLVTQDELLGAVWPSTHVQPEVLKYQIAEIRRVLGDCARSPLYIETLPRRGYRFIASVREGESKDNAVVAKAGQGELVGRGGPLSELRDRLREVLQGVRQIVFLTGEPGIGKTALADEFQRSATDLAPGIRVARGQCIEGYGGKEAYYPMLEALGKLCRSSESAFVLRTLADLAPTWAVQFPALLTPQERERLQHEIPGASRDHMLREICEALETITAEFPLLLVFEDLQWADPSTIDLISALARARTRARLMLIATKRPVAPESREHPLHLLKQELVSHHLCSDIALQPLSERDVAEYLAFGSQPEGLSKLVHRRSDGNPLFMIAIMEHLKQRGLVRLEDRMWDLKVPPDEMEVGVPEDLRCLVEARIDSLTSPEQSALEAASVTGASFSSSISAAAANMSAETFDELCEKLARRRWVVVSAPADKAPDQGASQTYEFVHAIYREVFYNRQTPGRRAKLHRLIGEQFESVYQGEVSEVAAQLAHHFEEAADWRKAIKYLQLAAETACRRHAPRECTASLRHALDLCAKLPDSQRAAREIEILEKLASLYVVSFDMRALGVYRTLRQRATHYDLVEVEIRALIDIAYPLSWKSTKRCIVVIDRALRLAASSPDPIFKARARASCLVRRLWASGWNSKDAEDCRDAIEQIRRAGDPAVLAWHLIDCNFIQWCSSEYREAHRSAMESLSILLIRGEEQNPYPSFTYWLSQFVLPWSLLLLGEWGDALREIERGIQLVDKNGDRYRAQTLLLYKAWVHLEAMDFRGVLAICESLFPDLTSVARSPWRRFCTVLAASADVAMANYDRAFERFAAVREEMSRQPVIHDWYCRMLLEAGLTELWLGKGDLEKARLQGRKFLDGTLATAERTWQARAWETCARVAMAERDLTLAQSCIDRAQSAMEGFETPLAAWRVHATAAGICETRAEAEAASQHDEVSRSIIVKLADSLQNEESMRRIFLSALKVERVLRRRHGLPVATSRAI